MKLFCFIFGHKFSVLQIFTWRSAKLKCDRCERRFAALEEDGTYIVPWNHTFEDFYKEVFGIKDQAE